jgi:hypothetical protein
MIDDFAVDEFLAHYGVRGMRWGVRRDKESSGANSDKAESSGMSRQKKAAIVLGSVFAVAAVGAGAYYAKQHFGVSVSSIPTPKDSTRKFTESLAREPVGIIHSSRGRNRGYAFLRDGGVDGLDQFMSEEAGFGGGQNHGFFRRFGPDEGQIAATFRDPLGRRDRAGRDIVHDVVLPRSMAQDVRSIDDVQRVAWPQIRDLFGAFYESEQGSYGPGF